MVCANAHGLNIRLFIISKLRRKPLLQLLTPHSSLLTNTERLTIKSQAPKQNFREEF